MGTIFDGYSGQEELERGEANERTSNQKVYLSSYDNGKNI